MDVILTTDVEKLGLRGEVVSVARGYMRNYLQPRGLAEIATPGRVAEVRRREDERARHEARTIEQAHEIATTLTKTVLRFEVHAGSTGTLFGSVTPSEIADEIWRTRKVRVDRRKIDLAEPIKRIGRYAVPIDVFQDVRVEVKTLVVPEGGELSDDELPDMTAPPAPEAEAPVEAEPPAPEAVAPGETEVPESEPDAPEDAPAVDVADPAPHDTADAPDPTIEDDNPPSVDDEPQP